MNSDTEKKAVTAAEEEVWIAIAAFEQILEAMPNDRASLEALSHAFAQIGDHTRAKEFLVRLGRVVIDERDADAASSLITQLGPYAAEDGAIQELLQSLRGLTAPGPDAAAPQELAPSESEEPARFEAFNLADELSFAWALLEREQVTQEEYASLVQDLTEMSASESTATVSVLHALELRAFRGLERLMLHVSKECNVPIVSLASFDIQTQALDALPLTFMVRRGALVFDFIGKEALVVVMNPHNPLLRKAVQSLVRKPCHFFLALPSDFDKAIGRAREIKTAAGALGR